MSAQFIVIAGPTASGKSALALELAPLLNAEVVNADSQQVYRGLDWNTVLLIGAMIAPALAMEKSGAARMIGDHIVSWLGEMGPIAVMIGLFLAATIITQFISNTSTALVMMPIGLAAATDMSVSAMPMIMAVAMGASASFLTPFANGVSLTVWRRA